MSRENLQLDYKKISGRIKKIRKIWGLTQKELAEILEIAVSTYQHYERGERDIPVKIIAKLCLLGVPSDFIFTGKNITSDLFAIKPSLTKEEPKNPNEGEKSVSLDKDSHLPDVRQSSGDDWNNSGKTPPATVFDNNIGISFVLLRDIITALEGFVLENKINLNPSRKAELIIVLYEQLMTMGGDFDFGTFERFMRAIKN